MLLAEVGMQVSCPEVILEKKNERSGFRPPPPGDGKLMAWLIHCKMHVTTDETNFFLYIRYRWRRK